MLQGFDENGILRGAKISENGEILVKINGGDDAGSNNETTLSANIITIGTTAQTINVGEKVTEISIANYSETANITVGIDNTNYLIGPSLALDLPINQEVSTISLTSSESDTKIQYLIKGEK